MSISRKLKWLWLVLNPPKTPCPRCGQSGPKVIRMITTKRHRCLNCYTRYDAAGNRYPWRDKEP